MTKKLLIDCDSLIYAAGYATEHTLHTLTTGDELGITFNNKTALNKYIKEYRLEKYEVKTRQELEPLSHALYIFKESLDNILKKFEEYEPLIFITSLDNSNFRYRVAETVPYKGNRSLCCFCSKTAKASFNEKGDTEKKCTNSECDKFEQIVATKTVRPVHYYDIRKYLKENWENIYECFCMEADDGISIYCNEYKEEDIIVVSIDKDLWQIEGPRFYNPQKGEFEELDLKDGLALDENRRKLYGTGEKWIYAQMLQGDSADNIQGIKGYGPVKIYNTLKDLSVESCRTKVKSIYNNDKHFEENLKLLTMLKTGKEVYYLEAKSEIQEKMEQR